MFRGFRVGGHGLCFPLSAWQHGGHNGCQSPRTEWGCAPEAWRGDLPQALRSIWVSSKLLLLTWMCWSWHTLSRTRDYLYPALNINSHLSAEYYSQVKMLISTFWPLCLSPSVTQLISLMFNMSILKIIFTVWGWWFAVIKHNVAFFFFRWNTYVVDGHSVEELCKAFWQAQQVKGKPTCIVAKTFKGKGLKSECRVLISPSQEKYTECWIPSYCV